MTDCAICLKKLASKDEEDTVLDCRHSFHKECLDTWFMVRRNCPLCRRDCSNDINFEDLYYNPEEIQRILDEYYFGTRPPPAPEISGRNAKNPTAAFIHIYHNGVEMPLCVNNLVGNVKEELEWSLRGLTAFNVVIKPKEPRPVLCHACNPATADGQWCYHGCRYKIAAYNAKLKPQRFYYMINLMKPEIPRIASSFIKRFGNPDKRWVLRMRPGRCRLSTGLVEVRFVLFDRPEPAAPKEESEDEEESEEESEDEDEDEDLPLLE